MFDVLFAAISEQVYSIGALATNLLGGMIVKHLTKIPNDFIPYINTGIATGIFALFGASGTEAVSAGMATAMGAKMIQTPAKRAMEWRQRNKE
jgi:hypothetical protein